LISSNAPWLTKLILRGLQIEDGLVTRLQFLPGVGLGDHLPAGDPPFRLDTAESFDGALNQQVRRIVAQEILADDRRRRLSFEPRFREEWTWPTGAESEPGC